MDLITSIIKLKLIHISKMGPWGHYTASEILIITDSGNVAKSQKKTDFFMPCPKVHRKCDISST